MRVDGERQGSPAPAETLFSPEFFADPFAYYGRLREADPVACDQENEVWLITRYGDVNLVVRDPETFSAGLTRDHRPPCPPVREEDLGALETVNRYRMAEFIQMDPPGHTAKRRVVSPRFSGRRLEGLRPLVRRIVDELLDVVAGDGGMDIVDAVCRPLPIRVINELIGIHAAERADVAAQATKRMASVLSLDADRMERSAEGFAETSALVERLVEERQAAGCPAGDDLLGDIAIAERSGLYTRLESQANSMLVIDAGHETTVQLIGNSTLSLLRNPGQWARLREAPDRLAASAVEECLRFDPPLHAVRRIVARDVELGGRTLRAGDRVMGVIASANRDPRKFVEPDTFEIGRAPNAHLSFGAGAHYCLGQYLARMEGQEFLRAVVARFPRLRLVTDRPAYFETPRVRSLTSLLVAWS